MLRPNPAALAVSLCLVLLTAHLRAETLTACEQTSDYFSTDPSAMVAALPGYVLTRFQEPAISAEARQCERRLMAKLEQYLISQNAAAYVQCRRQSGYQADLVDAFGTALCTLDAIQQLEQGLTDTETAQLRALSEYQHDCARALAAAQTGRRSNLNQARSLHASITLYLQMSDRDQALQVFTDLGAEQSSRRQWLMQCEQQLADRL